MSSSCRHRGGGDRLSARRGCSPPRKYAERSGWASLPSDLLLRVLQELRGNSFDYIRFRSVCSHWRSTVPCIKFPPLLMLPFNSNTAMLPFYNPIDARTSFFHLPQLRGKVFLGSSRGWLFLIDELACISLLNPFTGTQFFLPRATCELALASKKHVSNDGDDRWVISHPSWGRGWGEVKFPVTLADMRRTFISEATLLSPPSSTAADGCLVAAVLAESESLAICQPGDKAWKLKHTGLRSPIVLVANRGRTVYAMDKLGNVAVVEVDNSCEAPELIERLWLPRGCDGYRLLASRKELLVVGHYKSDGSQHRYPIFKCDLHGKMEWCKVESMGERSFFVSLDFKLNAIVDKFLECKGNSIWFSETEPAIRRISAPSVAGRGRVPEGTQCIEVMDLVDGNSEVIQYVHMKESSTELSWFTPDLF